MHISDIGITFDSKLARKRFADIRLVDGAPDELWFGTLPTELGAMTLVGAGDALAYLGFEQNRSLERVLSFFPKAILTEDKARSQKMLPRVVSLWKGEGAESLRVIVNATDFQKEVWNALLYIPTGHAVSYGAIAAHINRPKAVRAVGSAVGANPVSLLIPCHRVIQSTGKVENYGWGDAMKQKILKAETLI